MTVVLDTPAAIALIDPQDPGHAEVAKIFESNACYMTPEAVLWLYCLVYDQHGRGAAEYWLGFIADASDIRIAGNNTGKDFLGSAGHATLAARRLMHTGTSAALARLMRVPVVTNVRDVEALADEGFCEVKWF